jgi:ADP-heptose:LPS heptosyltransferase
VANLSLFSSGSMDAVFSSHVLEHFERDDVPTILGEWARTLKVGGNLVLYLPSANLYPKCGEDGANPKHCWDIYPGDIEAILRAMPCGWTLLESEERDGTNEYSLYIVARKRDDGEWVEDLWQRNPDGKKRALVVRFGAIGDQVQTASILPGLKKQGYHVTYLTTPEAREVVRHDPHIDEWWTQAKDYVPNLQLGPYFESLAERFDRIINLCESIEGALLTLPGRLTHAYPDDTRRKLYGGVNYLERIHDIAGVPHDFAQKFYPTRDGMVWANMTKRRLTGGAPLIVWAINGSSAHKCYPWTQVVTGWLLKRTPCHVVLSADGGVGKELQEGIVTALTKAGVDLARLHPMAGEWSIRQALTLAQVADCVVGPETGTMNAVAFEAMPKVIYLSHSSHTNLTRDWKNTTVLIPDGVKAPCYGTGPNAGCHRLHTDWTHCHQDRNTKAALCASAIAPERVFEAIAVAMGARKAA